MSEKTTEEEVRLKVERAISEIKTEYGGSLAIAMGEGIVGLEDRVVNEILASPNAEQWKMAPSGFIREQIVHSGIGTFVGGPDGTLCVRLRK